MRSGLVCKTASSVNSEMRSQADGSGNSIFRRTGYDAGELGLIFPRGKESCSRALTANCRDVSYTTSEFSCTLRLLSPQLTSEIYNLEFERQHLCLPSTAALTAKQINTKPTAGRRHWRRNEHLKYAQSLCTKWIYPLVTPCRAL